MIRQFDVFANPNTQRRQQVPAIVALQSHFLDALQTTVVAPLFKPEVLPAEGGVMLAVQLEERSYVLNFALIANIENRMLREPLGSLVGYEMEIRRAIDRLLTGF